MAINPALTSVKSLLNMSPEGQGDPSLTLSLQCQLQSHKLKAEQASLRQPVTFPL